MKSSPHPLSERATVLLAAVCAGAVASLYYNQPLLQQIGQSFASSHAGLVATATQIGYAGGLVLFVSLADRAERRRLVCLLFAGNAVGLAACALAPSLAALLLASLLLGLCAVSAQIIIPAVSGLVPASRRGRSVGLLLGGLSAGLLGARTFSGLLGAWLGWRAMFGLAIVLDIILVLVVRRTLPRLPPASTLRWRDLLASLPGLVRREPVLRHAMLGGFLMFSAFSALWGSLAMLLAAPPWRLGPAAAGAFGLIGVAGLLASPGLGRLADRLGAVRLFSLGAATLLPAFALLAAAAHSLVCACAGMALLDVGNRAGLVANQTRIFALDAAARSRLNTLFMCSYFLGGAFGSAVGSALAIRCGWGGVAAYGAAAALTALVIHALSWRASALR